jgi:hypothetical protein
VEEIIVTQESVRNKLEIDKDNMKATLYEISNRGESLVGSAVARWHLLNGRFTGVIYRPAP